MITFEEHYTEDAPGMVINLLAALEKVHLGCTKLGWAKSPCPITPELRELLKSFRNDYYVRASKLVYKLEDAEKVVHFLKE